MIVDNDELNTDLVLDGVHGVDVCIGSNYNEFVASLWFLIHKDKYYFKKNHIFYKCPSNITINDILSQMYGDHDHSNNPKSDMPVSSIFKYDMIEVEIYEKGAILYKD